tara:strand:+ start:91839 stop:92759 length:921 start_codon:yes stop_codon:yes gene_type:complete
MGNSTNIQIYNRYNAKKEIEKVYGDSMVRLIYENPMGKVLSPFFVNKALSKAYGFMQNQMVTQLKVPKFVKNFNIDLDEYEAGSLKVDKQELSYKNFNEFFIRKFKDGKRPFLKAENRMPAFAEARYYGHESMSDEVTLPVKGTYLRPTDLLGNDRYTQVFKGGPFLIARLCPVDYHRYHYPDGGTTLDAYSVHGDYHSVNPLALKAKQDIFIRNERRVAILETKNFGKLAYIEVGAVCVGKIVQSFDEKNEFNRGDEKGYFLFGGSTVIVLGERGLWKPSHDIISNTSEGIETYIHLGDEVAIKQ